MTLIDFFTDPQSVWIFLVGIIVTALFLVGTTYNLYGKNTIKGH
tara:strand:+ start:905 stop:1036 length:132 start_codon:yes stop_codon:yes gene_type:complete